MIHSQLPMYGKYQNNESMEHVAKKARLITAGSSPNFLNIDLRLFSLEQLEILASLIQEQIEECKRSRLKDGNDEGRSVLNTKCLPSQWIDIGKWTETDIENDFNKLKVWSQKDQQAPPDFHFPFSSNKRRCSLSHLNTFPFLRYSVERDAVYCLPCFLLKGKVQNMDILFVTKPFNNWKKLSERAKAHKIASKKSQNNLHKENVIKIDSLMKVLKATAIVLVHNWLLNMRIKLPSMSTFF